MESRILRKDNKMSKGPTDKRNICDNDETEVICPKKNQDKSKERVRKYREKRRTDDKFDMEKYHEKERERIKNLRKRQKMERRIDEKLHERYKEMERLRTKKYREKIKEMKEMKMNKYLVANKKKGKKLRRSHNIEKETKIKDLELKIKMLTNQNRRLKRSLDKKKMLELPSTEINVNPSSDKDTVSKESSSVLLLKSVSPASKKRALQRLKLDHTNPSSLKTELRLDKIEINSIGRKSNLRRKIENFLLRDENSVVCPDIKKAKKGLRYHLLSLTDLHEKFITDEDEECSFSQFTRYVPKNIIKPKPEDWGTCLCATCLNPELKLECVKRRLSNITISMNDLTDNGKQTDVEDMFEQIKDSNVNYEYLEWRKDVDKGKKGNKVYNPKKRAYSNSSENFLKIFKVDIERLMEHSIIFRSQYRRIREVKIIVTDPNNKGQFFRVDWSENVNLFQTRQEKSEFYNTTSASVNAAVAYSPDGVKGLGTISDVKSHTAPSTWASLSEIFKFVDLTNTETLYIASDSTPSQYRNKNNVFLTKQWAIKSNINVFWIFTETGHGKGPMDGIGAKIKTKVKDTIAFLPNEVISNTEELLNHLPLMDNISIATYTEDNVQYYTSLLPKPKNLNIHSAFGISKVHEIFFPKEDNDIIKWKKLSSDNCYTVAKIKMNNRIPKQKSATYKIPQKRIKE